MRRITAGLLITAATTAALVGGAGAASADKNVSGLLPVGQCRAEAARLNVVNAPPPERTMASGTIYYCYENAALGGNGIVRSKLWTT